MQKGVAHSNEDKTKYLYLLGMKMRIKINLRR